MKSRDVNSHLSCSEKSWFETGGAEGAEGAEGAAEAAEGGASPGAAEAPSAAASSPVAHACALCGDPFQQFYNEDKEEWHLRNAIKHERDYYHPLCFEDYKVSFLFFLSTLKKRRFAIRLYFLCFFFLSFNFRLVESILMIVNFLSQSHFENLSTF